MHSLIAGILLSCIAIYLTAIGILYGLFSHARYKMEESCKHIHDDYQYIPTEKQAEIVERELKVMKMAHKNETLTSSNKARLEYYDINVNRYRLASNTLNLLTFGKFKHFV